MERKTRSSMTRIPGEGEAGRRRRKEWERKRRREVKRLSGFQTNNFVAEERSVPKNLRKRFKLRRFLICVYFIHYASTRYYREEQNGHFTNDLKPIPRFRSLFNWVWGQWNGPKFNSARTLEPRRNAVKGWQNQGGIRITNMLHQYFKLETFSCHSLLRHWENNEFQQNLLSSIPRLVVALLLFSTTQSRCGMRYFRKRARNIAYGNNDLQ